MTWSYSGSPSSSQTDEVRFLAGLTNADDQQMSDEEIAYCISKSPNVMLAAAMACDYMQARYAREADIRAGANGELSIKFSQIAKAYADRAAALRMRALGSAMPWTAAISIDEKQGNEEDADRTQPAFKRNQFDSNVADYIKAPLWNNDGEVTTI